MVLARHCDLCDNQKTSLKVGTTCGLNDRKPEFNKTCAKIKLNEKFLKKLEETNLELEKIRRNKNKVYLTFYFSIAVGFLLIIASSDYAEWNLSKTYFWYYKIAMIGVGISILTSAYFKFNGFRNKLGNAEHEKNKIDEVLDEYGISYQSNIIFKDEIHGTQEIDIELKFKNWTKKTHHNNVYN